LSFSVGLDDCENLPGFYYRDDALELWEIMEKYVGNVLRCYYKCNEVGIELLMSILHQLAAI